MKANDWVSVGDIEFQIHSVEGEFLMLDKDHGYKSSSCTLLDTTECPRCHESIPKSQIYERYSYTVYAGKFCDNCCYSYRDNCGLDGRQGDPQDLDEPLYSDQLEIF